MRVTNVSKIIYIGLLAGLFLSIPAAAQEKDEVARRIEGELMAPCCWAEPVSQHMSPVAEEMRRDIRAMLAAGKSEQEILDFYVAKYGERILTTPPARGFNRLVYMLPWVIALAGAAALTLVLRRWLARRPAASAGPALDERYADRIDRELRDLD
jgi:cytochrome c-type biogenesis protein CcmH